MQALDTYPYDLSEVLEALNYAISCNNENAAAHCLMGRLYMEQLKDYTKAEYYYEQALIKDMNYTVTYSLYSLLLIYLEEYEKAEKLINHAKTLKGIDKSVILHRKGLICESKKEYKEAKRYMKEAFKESCYQEQREFMKIELDRVKSKIPKNKKKRSKIKKHK